MRVYLAIYCHKLDVLTLRHYLLADKWFYADEKRFYADDKWLYADDKRFYADDKWLYADDKRFYADGKWLYADGKWLYADDKWFYMYVAAGANYYIFTVFKDMCYLCIIMGITKFKSFI